MAQSFQITQQQFDKYIANARIVAVEFIPNDRSGRPDQTLVIRLANQCSIIVEDFLEKDYDDVRHSLSVVLFVPTVSPDTIVLLS